MAFIANKFYPISDIYFRHNKEIDLRPGYDIVEKDEQPIIGIHVFNWSSESWMTIENSNGQIIRFPSTALVEGAVYYIGVNKLISVGPNKEDTQIMAISTKLPSI